MNINKWANRLILLFGVLLGLPTSAALGDVEIESWLQRAEALQLAQHPDWLDLLHYKDHVFSGDYSQADDAAFFLSAEGQYDAAAELDADIRAFFAPVSTDGPQQHAQCRFPARLHWLDSQLAFKAGLPVIHCSELIDWQQAMQVDAVTLVFPAMYLHNPASMFGHTFLRLDASQKAPLLNFTLSYAAATDDSDSGLSYVFKGLTGGYVGVFSVQPYYETVQAYGDIENRDIWEYPLNLNRQEVDQLLRHVWEVRGIQFDYYFIRENCSYRLLSLLDVARPGMQLSRRHHPLYAAPTDTVRSVAAAGLVTGQHYRPARNKRILLMVQQMTEPAVQRALHLSTPGAGGEPPLSEPPMAEVFSPRQQAQILELAHEVGQLKSSAMQASHELLVARSQLKLPAGESLFQFEQSRPDQGHLSARWTMGFGQLEQHDFVELAIRPVFHDLLDPSEGFVQGSMVTVLDSRLRWYQHKQRLQLEQLTLFEMMSLSPMRAWSSAISAQFGISIERRPLSQLDDTHTFNLQGGLGVSGELANSLLYILADGSLEYARQLDDKHALYLGVQLGSLTEMGFARMMFKATAGESVSGQEGTKELYQWQLQFELSARQAIRMEYQQRRFEQRHFEQLREDSFMVNYLRYF